MKWGFEEIVKKSGSGKNLDELRKQDEEAFHKEQEGLIEKSREKIRQELAHEEAIYANKWEGFKLMAEKSEDFLMEADKLFQLFYETHKSNGELVEKYDKLLSELKHAIVMFLRDMDSAESVGEGAVATQEANLSLISDLCKQIYKIDKTFPNFKFLDKQRFIAAAKEETGIHSDKIEAHFLGRFAVLGRPPERPYGDGEYYFLDQQAKKIKSKKAVQVTKRNDAVIVKFEPSFLDQGGKFLFRGKDGKFSSRYDSLEWGVGNLIVGKGREGDYSGEYLILDGEGNVQWRNVREYTANKENTRALIEKDGGYNILLPNGELMFEKSRDVKRENFFYLRNDRQLPPDIYLAYDDKHYRLNKNLEIVAEGPTLKDLQRSEKVEEEPGEAVA